MFELLNLLARMGMGGQNGFGGGQGYSLNGYGGMSRPSWAGGSSYGSRLGSSPGMGFAGGTPGFDFRGGGGMQNPWSYAPAPGMGGIPGGPGSGEYIPSRNVPMSTTGVDQRPFGSGQAWAGGTPGFDFRGGGTTNPWQYAPAPGMGGIPGGPGSGEYRPLSRGY